MQKQWAEREKWLKGVFWTLFFVIIYRSRRQRSGGPRSDKHCQGTWHNELSQNISLQWQQNIKISLIPKILYIKIHQPRLQKNFSKIDSNKCSNWNRRNIHKVHGKEQINDANIIIRWAQSPTVEKTHPGCCPERVARPERRPSASRFLMVLQGTQIQIQFPTPTWQSPHCNPSSRRSETFLKPL